MYHSWYFFVKQSSKKLLGGSSSYVLALFMFLPEILYSTNDFFQILHANYLPTTKQYSSTLRTISHREVALKNVFTFFYIVLSWNFMSISLFLENFACEFIIDYNRVADLPEFSRFLKPLFLSGNFLLE